MQSARNIEAVDREVGARVRLRRKQLGISQTELATRVGVTFQQVQKYEKGTNRISASRMQQIALALDIPPASFFGSEDDRSAMGELVSDTTFTSKDGIELNRAFIKIHDHAVRRALIELVETLARHPQRPRVDGNSP